MRKHDLLEPVKHTTVYLQPR